MYNFFFERNSYNFIGEKFEVNRQKETVSNKIIKVYLNIKILVG